MAAKLFFQHVGREGTRADFPCSIERRLTLDVLQEDLDALPEQERTSFLASMERSFSHGFNCWGLPAPAASIFSQMEVGDVVALLGGISPSMGEGEVRCICRIGAKAPTEFWQSSQRVWNESKYPLMFFFDAYEVMMPWSRFTKDVGYRGGFDPRGRTYRVRDDRLASLPGGNADDYFTHVVDTYGSRSPSPVEEYLEEINRQGEPLQGEAARKARGVSARERDRGFSLRILGLFGERCAVCGLPSFRGTTGVVSLEAAHIVPVPPPYNGQDVDPNGMCLCKFHHWAFDAGVLTLEPRGEAFVVRIDKTALQAAREHTLVARFLLDFDGREIDVPPDTASPYPGYRRKLAEALTIRNTIWGL